MTIMEALRDVFGSALVEAGEKYRNVVSVSCDLKAATKQKLFFDKFEDRSFEVGIAEANAIGVATGLALSGYRPILSSFGAFLTGKNVEIRTSIAYNRAGVILVGTHGGLIGPDGATQSGLQDIAVMASMPSMSVFQPATPIEMRQMLDFACNSEGNIYLRVARNKVPELYDSDYVFIPGTGHRVRDGHDVVIFSSGPILHNCIAAAEALSEELSVAVCNIPSLKPLDRKFVASQVGTAKLLLSFEDHSVVGGLGSILALTLSELGLQVPFRAFGIDNTFICSGTPSELEMEFHLDKDSIAENVRQAYKF